MNSLGYELHAPTDGKGEGVYATEHFNAGETVMVGIIKGIVDENDSHATQVSRTKWVRHAGLGPKVNHSCNPNCGVRLNGSGACDFIARVAIQKGDEITFDYAMRNYIVEHFPDRCLCGGMDCRGTITGWKDLSREQKARYKGFVVPYLIELDQAVADVEFTPEV